MAKLPQSAPSKKATLDPPNTDAGAMERLFLLEAYTPGVRGSFVASDNLAAMRLMRQTIENRLRSPGEYGAASATSETDIIELGNQFAGFGDYPTLDASMTATLAATLAIANNPRHPLQAAYAQFVDDAITAATENVVPAVAKYPDVTAWRTHGSGSPGPRFKTLETLSGNTFYSTSPVPPMPRKHAKHKAPKTVR